jgi:APA family basic amino acid/polyamine antiporter
VPRWFGTVHGRLGTPVNASAFTGVSTAALALTVDIETLAQLVSIGTLVIFAGVCAGLLVRRHTPETAIHEPHELSLKSRQPALRRVACLTLACVAFAAFSSSLVARGVALGGAAAATVSFNSLPRHHQPTKGFATPFVPYVPALGVLATTQLIASLGALAWARFVVYTVLCSALYVWYGAAGIRGGWGPGSDGRLDAFRVMRESDDEGDAEGGMEMTPVGEDEKGGAGRGVSGGVSGGVSAGGGS